MPRRAVLSIVCALAVLLALGPFAALGESGLQLVNQTLTARRDIPLRASAPKGVLFQKGRLVATLEKGTRVDVKEQRSFATYRGVDIWIRVAPVEADTTSSGWAYYGTATKSENFK